MSPRATDFEKGDLIYEGKAKRLFTVQNHPDLIWQEFKDSLTAFNAQKKGSFENKGAVNRDITSLVFRFLAKQGVRSHWVMDIGDCEQITRRLTMLKVEVVVRNVLAGSTAKKFQFEEGTPLERPLTEFYYKEDVLNDPFISDEQALMLKVVSKQSELDELKRAALDVNRVLIEFFGGIGLDLIDFKIEFGRDPKSGQLLLADEITPDSCRLWDRVTREKMDKDRFRRDLGDVKESYEKVHTLLKSAWESKV
ncbi:MAG: phosphoribosylaminoimidazolesuccinocarboxamide synthase [Bdellovibrionaceae bacterium]|nr:phosphoribosylaminoimidazolesuccinocarboxamide synthase [Pseudobdellovibrionaceae bacterium]